MGLRDLLSSGGGRSGRLLPSDAPQTLEAFGRFEGPAPGGDMASGIDLGQTIKKGLEADPDRALDEIVEACDSIGGWSYYGAWDILSIYAPQRQDDPRYTHIVDGLLDTRPSRRSPPLRMKSSACFKSLTDPTAIKTGSTWSTVAPPTTRTIGSSPLSTIPRRRTSTSPRRGRGMAERTSALSIYGWQRPTPTLRPPRAATGSSQASSGMPTGSDKPLASYPALRWRGR